MPVQHSGKKKAHEQATAAAAAQAAAAAADANQPTGRGHGKTAGGPHAHDLRSGTGRATTPTSRGRSPSYPPPGPPGRKGDAGDKNPNHPPPFPEIPSDDDDVNPNDSVSQAGAKAANAKADKMRLEKLRPNVIKIKAAKSTMRREIDAITDTMRMFRSTPATQALHDDVSGHKKRLLKAMQDVQTAYHDIQLLDVAEHYEEYEKRLDSNLNEGRQPMHDLTEALCSLEVDLKDEEEERLKRRPRRESDADTEKDISRVRARTDTLTISQPLPRVHKPNESLRPDKLKRDNTPVEFKVWCDQFEAYYSSSKMDQCTVLEQQAYFKACLDSHLAATISAVLTEKTPVITEWVQDSADPTKLVPVEKSAMLMLNEIFVYNYPFYNRRFDYYCAKQPQGLTAGDWVRKLQRMRDECALSLLSEDEKFVHRILTSLTDKDLVRELLKLNDPTLQELVKEIGRYEINRKRMKVTNKTNANVIQSKTNNPPASKSKTTSKDSTKNTKTQQQQSSKTASKTSSKSGPATLPFQCYRCGERDKSHKCKAKEHVCKHCNKRGHYAGMCLSKARARAILATLDEAPTTNAATTSTDN